MAERSFAILEYVARAGGPVSVTDIMEHLDLPKATAYRLADWFEVRGLLTHEPGRKRLVIGPRLTTLAFDVLRASVHQAPRRAILQTLVEEVGETCNIGTLDGTEVVYLDRVEAGHWPLRLQFGIGSHVPAHCTAIGKIFLSLLPARQRRRLLSCLTLRRYTDHTITDHDAFAKELEVIRTNQFATDNQEFLAGVVCIAVPILSPRGEIRAAVAVQAPEARMTIEDARRHVPSLRLAASRLSTSFDSELANTGSARRPGSRRVNGKD